MRGDEVRVVAAFCEWLRSHGWQVTTEVDYIDVLAERGDERLYAEAKGSSDVIGLDVDTLYGQLLRRMPPQDDERVRFAAMVMDEPKAVRAALRVPERIREALRIHIYAIDQEGNVRVPSEEEM